MALAGCQSPGTARLGPLRPQLDHEPGSGARYLVLVNSSGRELHHCSFAAFLCDEHDPNPLFRLQPFARCSGKKVLWRPDEEARFQSHDSPSLEFPITQPVSRVEVVGHSDEGSFHQCWRLNQSEPELRPPGVQPQFSFVPGMPAWTNMVVTR